VGGPQSVAHQLQAAEVAGGGQDVRRVGALSSMGREQAAGLASLNYRLQKEAFGTTG
jgi:hypothetical protein